jgi:hypothetical protein
LGNRPYIKDIYKNVPGLSSFIAEEIRDDGGAFFGEDAGDHEDAVVEAGVGCDPVEASDGAGLRVIGKIGRAHV